MRLFGSLIFLTMALGCGGSTRGAPKVELVPVQGTVKLGGKPTPDILVSLSPSGSTKGNGAWAKTDASGLFKLIHFSNQEGVEPGEYVISFSYFVTPDGTPVPPNTSPTEVTSVQAIASPWTEATSESPSQRVNVKKEGMMPLSFDVPPTKNLKRS